jgi:hypothetical protein
VRRLERGYFYCTVPGTSAISGPTAISTQDLTGTAAGDGREWDCVEVPIDTISHYGTKAVNLLERLGIFLFEA